MEEAPKRPVREGVLPARPPAQKDKRVAGGIKSTATSKATISRRNSNMGPSVKIEDDHEPKPPIREPISSKQPAPGAVDGPPATVKRKREETPEKKPKKVKAEEESPKPHWSQEDDDEDFECYRESKGYETCGKEYDPADQDDDVISYFHPGNLVIDPTAACWNDDMRGYTDTQINDWYKYSNCLLDGCKWDCCGRWNIADGCTKRNFHK